MSSYAMWTTVRILATASKEVLRKHIELIDQIVAPSIRGKVALRFERVVTSSQLWRGAYSKRQNEKHPGSGAQWEPRTRVLE